MNSNFRTSPCSALITAFLFLTILPTTLQASETREYVYLTNGSVTGGLTMTIQDDRHREVSFQ